MNRLRATVGVIVATLLALMVVGQANAAPAGTDRPVVLVTAPPYMNVSALQEALTGAGRRVVTVRLEGDFPGAVRRLDRAGGEMAGADVVAVGAAVLPLRWWLQQGEARSRPGRLVLVAPAGDGSVAADALYAEQLATRIQVYRNERDMHRTDEGPVWARPEYVNLQHYVAHRSRDLFEPLYGSYLASQHLSLLPGGLEGAVGFMGWLATRYPARLPAYLDDAETPIGWDGELTSLEAGEAGQILSWGYIDLLSALTARRTYFTTVPAARVLGEDLLQDVVVGPDWKTTALEFARRRAARFVRDYVLPNLAGWGRHEAVSWLRKQLDLREEVLLYQLPRQVTVPGPDGPLPVPANQLIRQVNAGCDRSGSVVVAAAPNWWQLFNPHIGTNDWWAEVESDRSSASEVVELFVPVGGRAGQDGEIAAAALGLLGITGPEGGRHILLDLMGRLAEAVFNLAARLRYPVARAGEDGGGTTSERGAASGGVEQVEEVDEDIPEIRATYRNKSTTLKTERRVRHAEWTWDFGDGETHTDADAANLSGEMEHTFAGAGEYEVTARPTAGDGQVLAEEQWTVAVAEGEWAEVFPYDTAAELVPEITLNGPECWVVGRPARYSVEVHLEEVPEQVENLRAVIYPDETFDVVWERPGIFQVRGAVNLRYSWRRTDGSSRHFSVIFTEERPVEVLATSLTGQ
ncbi:MAG: PKD domain-containing protein [Bacillota bacterium]